MKFGATVVFISSPVKVFLFSILFLFVCSNGHARSYEGFGPFTLRTQNPVYLQNLGLTPTRAENLPHGTIELRVDSAYTNLFERSIGRLATIDLDMELWRNGLNLGYGLTRDLEVGVEIPFYSFYGGFLDGFVNAFHDFFRFPTGSRKTVSDNRFSYRATAGGATLFDFPNDYFGLGDIVLFVKNQLTGEDDDWPALSWFANIKIPTGQRSRGLGSGAPDFGFGAALEASYKRLHGHFNVAYFALGGSEYLEDFQYNEMFSYMAAGEVSLLPTLAVLVQLAGSTPLLKGISSDQWNGIPLDLVIGFKGEEKNLFKDIDLIWQVGFSEDVSCRGPSVDFTVFMSIGIRFDLLGRRRPAGDWLVMKR